MSLVPFSPNTVKRFQAGIEALATCHTVKQLGSTGALVGNQAR